MKVVSVGDGDRGIIGAIAPGYHECCVLSSTGIEGLLPLPPSAICSESTVYTDTST